MSDCISVCHSANGQVFSDSANLLLRTRICLSTSSLMTTVVAHASTSRLPVPSAQISPTESPATLETCREIQEDEQLALEVGWHHRGKNKSAEALSRSQAIYEDRFECSSTADGRRVFAVQIDIDLQEDTECIVICDSASREPPDRKSAAAKTKLTASARPFIPPQRDRASHVKPGVKDHASTARDTRSIQQVSHAGRLSPASNGHDGSPQEPLSMTSVAEALPDATSATQQSMRLRYLTPVTLKLTMPAEYPLERPPIIDLQAIWLSVELRALLLQRLAGCKQATEKFSSSRLTFSQCGNTTLAHTSWPTKSSSACRTPQSALVHSLFPPPRLHHLCILLPACKTSLRLTIALPGIQCFQRSHSHVASVWRTRRALDVRG